MDEKTLMAAYSHMDMIPGSLRTADGGNVCIGPPDFGDGHRVGFDAFVELEVAGEPTVRGRSFEGRGAFLDQGADGIQAEAVDADVLEPEPGHIPHFCGDVGVGVVQIGHPLPEEGIEVVTIQLMPYLVAPGALPTGVSIGPDVPGTIGRLRIL